MKSMRNDEPYCGFCLKQNKVLKKENIILHAGLEAFICDNCVETFIFIKSKNFTRSKIGKKLLKHNVYS